MKRGIGVMGAIAVFAAMLTGVSADDPVDSIEAAGSATALAEPVFVAPDVVSITAVVSNSYDLRSSIEATAIAVAVASGGSWSMSRGANIGMHAVRRGPAVIQQAPDGYNYPMTVTALPISTVAQLMGRPLSGILSNGFVIMGRTTADLRGAQVGDAIDMVPADGGIVQYIVGAIVDDATIGDTEILMSNDQAELLGLTADTRILLWGFPDRGVLDQQLAGSGLTSLPTTRIRRSWDPFDPDSEIGMAQTKAALGEFAYRALSNGTDVAVTGDWEDAYMPPAREVLTAAIPIRARCNLAIRADLQAALNEVAAAGLGGQIDVANANSDGGCYYPRYNRLGGQFTFLSRHSWGQALDTNTNTNPQGSTPRMNCDVVRIFRKHNFAWGGNFVNPDGMHFEWVGTRRDQYQYPSKYCPNLPSDALPTQSFDAPNGRQIVTGLSTLFADDGFSDR